MEPLDPNLLNGEAIEIIFTAKTWTEAIVVRGLLESAGIRSPALADGYLTDVTLFSGGFAVYCLESQAQNAKRLIADYLIESSVLENEAASDDDYS